VYDGQVCVCCLVRSFRLDGVAVAIVHIAHDYQDNHDHNGGDNQKHAVFCKEPRTLGRLRVVVRFDILFAGAVAVAGAVAFSGAVAFAGARGKVRVVYVWLHAVVLGRRHFLNAVNTDTPRS
jgi:hypothetical protein